MASLVADRYDIDMSYKSVQRGAKLAGLTAFKRPSKPLLTTQQRIRRLAFAEKYTAQNWRRVLFSDEKTFELFMHPKNQYVWTDAAANVPVQPTVKHPPKLHVWAGFGYNGKTELYCFTGTMDKEFYLGILQERLVVDSQRIFGRRRWLFQQDGDPKHTAHVVQRWLNRNVSFIPKEDWPSQSPDLNPMEHLWAYLQDKVYAREPRTMDGLQRIIEEEWNRIPTENLHRLADSMSRRLEAVRMNQGGPTTY